ncbi:hypothetical protein KKD37_03750 [Patescibacteria group bacterium]|nr:hypothetical protein [Patescibacteria group bacterium]
MATIELREGKVFDVYRMNRRLVVANQLEGGNMLGMGSGPKKKREWSYRDECCGVDIPVERGSSFYDFLEGLCRKARV